MHEINFADKKGNGEYTIHTVEGDINLKQIDENTISIESKEKRDFQVVEHLDDAIAIMEKSKNKS